MAKITAIKAKEKDKDKCSVFLDGEYAFSLYIDTVLDLRLKIGDDVDESKLLDLKLQSEKETCFKKALKYAVSASKTRKQIADYLKRKEFGDNAIHFAIEKLKEYGYVDDVDYARRYVETYSVNQGRKLIEKKLCEKGIAKCVIDQVFSEIDIDGTEGACALAEKKFRGKEITKDLEIKVKRYLLGRGYSYSEIERAVERVKGER